MANIELAKKNQEILQELYNKLKNEKELLNIRLKEINIEIKNCKEDSVKEVLDFIVYNYEHLKKETISNLCFHCIKVLNGNTDGIEVELKYDE